MPISNRFILLTSTIILAFRVAHTRCLFTVVAALYTPNSRLEFAAFGHHSFHEFKRGFQDKLVWYSIPQSNAINLNEIKP